MTERLTKEAEEIIGRNINVNMNTLLKVISTIKFDPNAKSEIRDTKTFQLLLGCIGIALTVQADLMLSTASKSSILAPN